MSEQLLNRLKAPGPKRILALDGGGIRGALTLGFLIKLEKLLAPRSQNPEAFRLRDYFDLIGGTSTGAIIAAGLAIGKSADEIKDIYLKLGSRVFGTINLLYRPWSKFDERPLVEELVSVFGSTSLGSEQLTTGLCVITKRADTGSIWPLINHPDGKFYDANSAILLVEALRASAAAPTIFVPQMLPLGDGTYGAFVDGGFSMANNPALQLFMIATLKGYPFHWEASEDKLLVTSIGTGIWHQKDDPPKVQSAHQLEWAGRAPVMFMEDAMWFNQQMLQAFSRSPTAVEIDSEVGDLGEDYIGGVPLLSYLRYNVELSVPGLDALGYDYLAPHIEKVRDMTNPQYRAELFEIGSKAADLQIDASHFQAAFDRV